MAIPRGRRLLGSIYTRHAHILLFKGRHDRDGFIIDLYLPMDGACFKDLHKKSWHRLGDFYSTGHSLFPLYRV